MLRTTTAAGKAPMWLRAALCTIAAVALVLAIYTVGSTSGSFILRLQKEYRVELFEKAVAQQGTLVKLLSDEEAHDTASKYIAAIADATIRFELFPQKGEAEAFLEILTAQPAKITVERFSFTGHDLTIYCSAETVEPINQFVSGLGSAKSFREVTLETERREDGRYIGTIFCTAN